MKLSPGDKLFITGGFRSGKTTALQWLVKERTRASLVYDPRHEWTSEATAGTWINPATVDDIPAALHYAPHVSFQGDPDDDDEADRFFALACRLGGYAVVVDELPLLVRGHHASQMPRRLSELQRTCHKDQTSLLVAAHLSREVPRILRMVHHRLYFKTSEADEVQAVRQSAGDVVDDLQRAPPYHYIYHNGYDEPRLCNPVPKAF